MCTTNSTNYDILKQKYFNFLHIIFTRSHELESCENKCYFNSNITETYIITTAQLSRARGKHFATVLKSKCSDLHPNIVAVPPRTVVTQFACFICTILILRNVGK